MTIYSHLLGRTMESDSQFTAGTGVASVSSKFRIYMLISPASFFIGATIWLQKNLLPKNNNNNKCENISIRPSIDRTLT